MLEVSRARAFPAALVGLVVLSTALRTAAAHSIASPWIAPDEMLYGLLGRDLYTTGHLHVLGRPAGFYSLAYPALVGLPLTLHDTGLGYAIVKAIGALVMSLTAVPVYLWGRTVMRPGWALLAAGLSLAIGGLAYSGMVMTEVAFYPAFVLAAWTTARALVRPTFARQALALAAVALAVATRLQAIVLLPAALTAIGLQALFDRDGRSLRRYAPLAAAGAVLVAAAAARGTSSLGGYSVVASAGYSPSEIAKFVVYHLAGLLLLCGVVPLCALVPLAVGAARGQERSPEARALIAVAVSFSIWVVVEVGVFASEYAVRIVERNLLGLAPLLFLAFGLWLDRGAPRSYAVAAGTAFAAAAVLVSVPYTRFVALESVQDSMSFAAGLRVLQGFPGADPLLVVATPAVVLAALFALAPRRLAPLLAAIVCLVLMLVSVGSALEVRTAAATTKAQFLGTNPRWIDHARVGPTAYVFGGTPVFTTFWVTAFWNRAVRAVYDMPGLRVDGPVAQAALDLGGDGVMRTGGRTIPYAYAVFPGDITPAGERIASETLLNAERSELVLWHLTGTPRVLEQRLGFFPNGDVSYKAELREYDCARGGTFIVTLFGKESQRVTIALDGRAMRTVPLLKDEARTEEVHARAGPDGSCTLTITPTTLVGTTQALFARG
jgi:hypothetical protein